METITPKLHRTLHIAGALVAAGIVALLAYLLLNTRSELAEARREHQSLTVVFNELAEKYAISEEENAELLTQLERERERNDDFEDQIDDLTGTVGQLDKLSKLDKELLQKYSKIYFLNEHYTPSKVKAIDKKFVKNSDGMLEYIHADVEPYLDNLLEDAKDDGIDLLVISAYRSFDEQKGLKSAYTVSYGSGANTFSADQGYSEHQLGTTVDFSTPEINGALVNSFETTKAYAWLEKNAHRYGFTLSYPKGNAYYIYEPWHWRFVGEELARDLRDDKKHFYDLDQREIDKYLISIFD